jgi:hypothetical protein
VPEKPSSKKSTDPTDALHAEARKVQDTLRRLLAEVNELLTRTKRSQRGENPSEPARPSKTSGGGNDGLDE